MLKKWEKMAQRMWAGERPEDSQNWAKTQCTNRPPKGDRSEGFYMKIRFLSFFLDFGLILLKIILFYMEIEPGWLRNKSEYLKKKDFGSEIKLKNQFWTPKPIAWFFETLNFQCSPKKYFLSHTFQDPSCRKCSYGPHGPCWFSVKIAWIWKNVTKTRKLWKWLFEITVKIGLFCGGQFAKGPLC